MSQQGPILSVVRCRAAVLSPRRWTRPDCFRCRHRLGRGRARGRAVAAGRGSRRDACRARARICDARQASRGRNALRAADRGARCRGRVAANALPFSSRDGNSDRLVARLRAALRVRSLHATVLRRLPDATSRVPEADPARDATVLLIGRGAAYPALSVALGERMGVVGALSIEAAAKHLNTRDIDGIVLAEGFSPRVIDAFLTVLAEDTRFRNLPVVVTAHQLDTDLRPAQSRADPRRPGAVAANALPLIRQHAMEAQLSRTLRSIDAGGWLDPRSGLLTVEAFARDFAKAVEQALARGGGLSVARFAFEPGNSRAQLDAARILSRLMRQMDFGVAQKDGSVIVVFAETDFRTAHMIARRLSAVMRHTSNGKHEMRSDPVVSVDSLSPSDTARSLLGRLSADASRAAS